MGVCVINDKLLKEITDILSNANGKLQVGQLYLQQTNLTKVLLNYSREPQLPLQL